MKTTATNTEAVNFDQVEKKLTQILEGINSIRPVFFKNELQFSIKAKEEKMFLYKKLFPERVLGINKIQSDYNKILEDTNLSKLEKADLDFILDLEKIGFKKSQYVTEMNVLAQKEENLNDAFFNFFIGESIYFNSLSSELRIIQYKLDDIRRSNP